MIQHDWLYNYQYIDELEIILGQMDRRFGAAANMKASIALLKEHHDTFEAEFTEFFEALQQFSADKKQELIVHFSNNK